MRAPENSRTMMMRNVVTVVMMLSLMLLAPSADAHHSYAMYDGTVYRVFTGVIVHRPERCPFRDALRPVERRA